MGASEAISIAAVVIAAVAFGHSVWAHGRAMRAVDAESTRRDRELDIQARALALSEADQRSRGTADLVGFSTGGSTGTDRDVVHMAIENSGPAVARAVAVSVVVASTGEPIAGPYRNDFINAGEQWKFAAEVPRPRARSDSMALVAEWRDGNGARSDTLVPAFEPIIRIP